MDDWGKVVGDRIMQLLAPSYTQASLFDGTKNTTGSQIWVSRPEVDESYLKGMFWQFSQSETNCFDLIQTAQFW